MIKTWFAVVVLGLSLLNIAYAEDVSKNPAAAALAASNLAKGEAFLAANKNKPGVVTLADGLQYKVLIAGSGQQPGVNDIVSVNYEGKLINGTVFDSSYQRGQPASFPVGGVIPGWVEALQLMKVGSTWELYIPAKLAYGEQGVSPDIGPNEVLIFKVELLGIQK